MFKNIILIKILQYNCAELEARDEKYNSLQCFIHLIPGNRIIIFLQTIVYFIIHTHFMVNFSKDMLYGNYCAKKLN